MQYVSAQTISSITILIGLICDRIRLETSAIKWEEEPFIGYDGSYQPW